MSTSERVPIEGREGERGFSLIEILLGLTLALALALGVAPVWVSFEALAADEGDQTIWTRQGRVATARFERDVRLSSSRSCVFPTSASVLQATRSQVVFLVGSPETGQPIVVEWELVGGSLMRRWGPCPAASPATFPHSLFPDSKTMLEHVDTVRSRFTYIVAGRPLVTITEGDLPLISSVGLHIVERGAARSSPSDLVALAEVGR